MSSSSAWWGRVVGAWYRLGAWRAQVHGGCMVYPLHHVREAGRASLKAASEKGFLQVDWLRLHILQIQGQLDQLSHTGGRLAPLARSAMTPR
eukprot:scaffold4002_cov67-Phaeocystis_antarctica.AAC.1